MPRPDGLILDYGNVLTRAQDQTWMDGAARRLGADATAFRAAYWQHRHDYDADLSAAAYWGRVLAVSRPGADALDPVDLAWLVEADIASWSVYHDEVWTLAAEFRRSGGRTAFLSNSGPEVMARVRGDRALEVRFDAVVISCEVGLSKPDPRIYQLCLDRLGLAARETLFVDDRADNVEGAARVGLRTVRGPRRARAVAGPGPLVHAGHAAGQPGQFPSRHGGILPGAIIAEPT
jgi:putative hydrolase of the HAD superfamily